MGLLKLALMFPSKPFTTRCPNCTSGTLKLDKSAFDSSCQGKHVFLFECDHCGKYSATSMRNIDISEWYKFVPTEHLAKLQAAFKKAERH